MNKLKLREMLQAFFIEDIGERDATTASLFHGQELGSFRFIAKEGGVFSGTPVIETGFRMLDEKAVIDIYVKEGESFKKGTVLAEIKGCISALLMGERVILNLVQRMSGIATQAHKAAQAVKGTKTMVCDTRKTTPGLRMLEKYAAVCGGASNHRFGLYDGIMIKDNHIDFIGSITEAIRLAKGKSGHMVKVEVETSTPEQVLEAVEAGADIIMFDNCTPEEIKRLAELVPPGIITEASGGITLESLGDYRDTGVDYISLGCLTHSVRALDISAKVLILE